VPRISQARSAALANGWRSGLEDAVGAYLEAKGIPHHYEELVIPFEQPPKPRKYTADFYLPNGIVIETKGRFVTADRQKHLMVKKQHEDLDIRFVFSNPNQRIAKKSETTYAKWCESKGFKYAKVIIPDAWLREPVNHKSLAAIRALMEEK
jgi:hypothetical protein